MMNSKWTLSLMIAAAISAMPASAQPPISSAIHRFNAVSNATAQNGIVDTVIFGNPASETSHAINESLTEPYAGALGQTARRCLPKETLDLYGGDITITMAVDPTRRNYVTIKLWGDDDTSADKGRIYLYVPIAGVDYQIGYRHEGDYMPLSVASGKSPLPGRFYYSTTLLPLWMTQGKTSLTLKLVSAGRIYPLGGNGYEGNGGKYQYYMKMPSFGIYRAYTHTDPILIPSGEVQGSAPKVTVRPSPGEEVLAPGGMFSTGVNNRIKGRLSADPKSFTATDVQYLARSYSVEGLAGYHNQAVVDKVIAVIDAFATDYYANPKTAPSSGGNEGWGGRYGAIGYAIQLLKPQLQPSLDAKVNYGTDGGDKTRRQAWGDILIASRDFGRMNRRIITNQTLIGDTNVYGANKGLIAIGDSRAFSDIDAQRYLREAIGLTPWLGNDLANGGHEFRYGSQYYMVTKKGLTREWGFLASSYGEMAIHAIAMYESTGNPEFRDQAAKMLKARAAFRRPSMETSGTDHYRTMENMGYLAWRGAHESDGDGFSTETAYGDRTGWATALRVAAVTLDPTIVGYAKQMLADNQYFNSLVGDNRTYGDLNALEVWSDYQKIKAAPDKGTRLPMTEGQADFAWADEEEGILAIKHGTERLWIEPYWQVKTGTGINGIARFQYDTPQYAQIGVCETVPQFTASDVYTRSKTIMDKPEGNEYTPPNSPRQAYGGEKLPIGFIPSDAKVDAPFRGKVDFYAFRFGRYLIGMNRTSDRNFVLKTPKGLTSAPDLFSGKVVKGVVKVAPNSTVALALDTQIDTTPIPSAPLALTAILAPKQITLNWSAASGATSYIVKRATNAAGPYTQIANGVAGTTYTDTSAADGTTYSYMVAAVNANGESYDSMSAQSAWSSKTSEGPQMINPGAIWPDNRGQHIQAHGGGILKLADTYYWFGEDRSEDNERGKHYVSCYSAQDLVHWTWRNQVVAMAAPPDIGPRWVLERPKVFYNALTKKFVMYVHLDGGPGGYSLARVGVLTCDTVDGNYTYLKSFRPLGHESRDIGQFVDDDGSAYLIFEDRPFGFRIAKLSDDYLTVEREMSLIPQHMEGGALVHYNGLYYLVGSALTGWNANANKYATSTSLSGPWSEFKDIAPPAVKTYGSQSTMMLKVVGTKTTSVIFMGDIWKPSTQWDSRYLWMPVQIGDGKLWLPEPHAWTLDVKTGEAVITK